MAIPKQLLDAKICNEETCLLNYKINKLDEYLHRMLNATNGKYKEAIQDTIFYLNMLKQYKGGEK